MPFDSGSMKVVRRRRRRAEDRPVDEFYNDQERFSDVAVVVASLSVVEVIELIESGEVSVGEVIEAERVGKSRKTILSLIQSESGKVYPVSRVSNENLFAG